MVAGLTSARDNSQVTCQSLCCTLEMDTSLMQAYTPGSWGLAGMQPHACSLSMSARTHPSTLPPPLLC